MLAALVALLLFAALAIDLTYVRTTQFELRNAADAAAHAALIELRRSGDRDVATALGQAVAELNFAAGEPVTIDAASFTYGEWDFRAGTFDSSSGLTNAVTVVAERNDTEVDGPVKLFLGPLFGHPDVDARAAAVGAYRSRDVMITLDVTSSFIAEMDDAVSAVVGFLDEMRRRRLPNDRIGLNTFTGGSSVVTELQDVDGNYAAIRSVWRGDGKSNKDKGKSSGLTNCFECTCKDRSYCGSMYKKKLAGNWMQSCEATGDDGVEGKTSQGPGLRVAREHLDANDTLSNARVIVLVSDGTPTCPDGDFRQSPCAKARAAYAVAQADVAYEAGISIFTVSMNTRESAAQEAFMASLVRGYGRAYNTAESSDLEAILTEIAQSIPIALVE